MRKSEYKKEFHDCSCYRCDYLSCRYKTNRKSKQTKCPIFKEEMKGVLKRSNRRTEKCKIRTIKSNNQLNDIII